MEAVFSWLSNLINFFGSFIPRLRICRKTHKGLKYVHGDITKLIEPGLFVYWPLVTEYDLIPVVDQILNLSVQAITINSKSYVVDGCVCYEIVDVEKYLTENYDSEEGMLQVASAAIRDCIVDLYSIEKEFRRNQIDKRLTKVCADLLGPQFGVAIKYVKLVSFAEANVIHLSGGLNSITSLYTSTPNSAVGT